MASTACCCFSPSSHGRPHSLHPHLPTITTSTTHARLRLRLVSLPAPSRCPLQISSSLSPPAGRVYFGDGAQFVDPDPGHSYQEIRQQIFGLRRHPAQPRREPRKYLTNSLTFRLHSSSSRNGWIDVFGWIWWAGGWRSTRGRRWSPGGDDEDRDLTIRGLATYQPYDGILALKMETPEGG